MEEKGLERAVKRKARWQRNDEEREKYRKKVSKKEKTGKWRASHAGRNDCKRKKMAGKIRRKRQGWKCRKEGR